MLPSVWPETYCYTLSVALRAGLYPVCFDIGAPAERLRSLGCGELLPVESKPGWINERLLALEIHPDHAITLSQVSQPSYGDVFKDYYDGLDI